MQFRNRGESRGGSYRIDTAENIMDLFVNIYNLILSPFTALLSAFFSLSWKITANYGVSLILLSFFITLVTSPLYYLAEKWKNQDKTIQNKMAGDILRIKKNYTGQKRFYLIKTARRIYGYNSFYAFKTSFGLLIQIPFFFAAYSLLSHYKDYRDISFLFINDLGRPDGLFFGISVLPFLMTGINILSAFYYNRSFSLRDNGQALIMAGVFLVLLYDSPAALLVYWTMNNIFSLIKNIVFRKTGIQPVPVQTHVPGGQLETGLFQNRGSVGLSFLYVLLCSLSVYWAANFPASFKYLIAAVLGASVIFSFFTLYLYRLSYKTLGLFLLWILSAPLLYVFYTDRKDNLFISNTNLKLFIVFLGGIIGFYPFFLKSKKPNEAEGRTPQNLQAASKGLFLLLTVSASFYILFYQPLLFYLSSPTDINISLGKFSLNLLIFFVLAVFLITSAFFVLPSGGKKFFSRIILFILLMSLTWSTALRLNTGMLDDLSFQNVNAVSEMSFIKYFLDPFALIFLWAISPFILAEKRTVLKFSCAAFLIILSAALLLKLAKTDKPALKPRIGGSTAVPESAYDNHIFTASGKNIIFFIADMFNGNYIGRLISGNAEYTGKLDGFTWFPDCLSVSYNTGPSLPAILAGDDFLPLKLNNNGLTGMEETERAADIFFKHIAGADYSVTVANPVYFRPENTFGAAIEDINDYIDAWKLKNGYDSNVQFNKSGILYMLSIFNSVPYHWKYIIHDDSNWLIFRKFSVFGWMNYKAVQDLAYIDLLPDFSSVSGSSQNRFFYIHNNLPHQPFGIDKNGNPVRDSYPDEDKSSFTSAGAAYYSAKKTIDVLIRWFNWMKANNVYDNTMIVILSDHGNTADDSGIVLPGELKNPRSSYDISRADALLLIKGFNERSPLKIDKTPVSSSDIGSILKSETEIPFSSQTDPRLINGVRERIYSSIADDWKEFLDKDTVKYRSYKVKGSIFEPEAWSIYETN
jgi:membrane protein insertase Oxa1/YidC/SpoIIIJ